MQILAFRQRGLYLGPHHQEHRCNKSVYAQRKFPWETQMQSGSVAIRIELTKQHVQKLKIFPAAVAGKPTAKASFAQS